MRPERILFATDLSYRCDRALDRTVSLAREWTSRLIVLHALEAPSPVIDAPSWRRPHDPRRTAERRIRDDLDGAGAPDVEIDVLIERGEPAPLILDAAKRLGCELIVTGIRRDDAAGTALLGRTVGAVVRGARVPVLTVKARARGPYRSVAVASDFSEDSRRALLTTLALFPAATVRLFHAHDVLCEGFIDDKMAARDSAAEEARAEGRAFMAGVPPTSAERVELICEYGSPTSLAHDLVETADVELVVAGTRGRGRVVELVLGSVAQELLATLPGDVMVVPRA
ncbi:MAG: universal stress protein [Labilithrix sp.]|nr:universal stress protein [Labilithrix sp.]MBX3215616.1 universal stress protein [Labilithrix sp.]